MMSSQEVIRKADMVLNDLVVGGGLLQPAQARKFLRIAIERSVLLPLCSVIPMKRPSMLIDKIRFASRITHAGTENTALPLGQHAVPNLGQVELATHLYKAEVRLSAEVLEDNIEQANFKDTLLQLIAERVSLDIEDIVINSATVLVDPDLNKFNGLRAAVTTHVYDHLGNTYSKAATKGMVKAMPNEFIQDRSMLRVLYSIDADTDYRDLIAERATQLGDETFKGNMPLVTYGVPHIPVGRLPETLGAGHDSEAYLIDPKNCQVGFWRQVQIETDKDISAGTLIIVVTFRMGFVLAEETAAVKAINILVG
jgi:HK97 family phage major capsid protein